MSSTDCLRLSVITLFAALGLSSATTLNVLYCPQSIRFSDSSAIPSSSLADFLSLTLGYSLAKPFKWTAIEAIEDVFSLPKSVVVLKVDGDLEGVDAIQKWPLLEAEDLNNEIEILSERMRKRFENNFFIKSNEKAKEESELEFIKNSIQEAKNTKSSDGMTLRALFYLEIHEKESKDNIKELIENFRTLFNDQVIIVAIEEPLLIRKTRATDNQKALNLGHQYEKDFHTAFATIAFTTLLIGLSVLGVSVSMWHLDPGRDSIIYRMTSQRIKKEQ